MGLPKNISVLSPSVPRDFVTTIHKYCITQLHKSQKSLFAQFLDGAYYKYLTHQNLTARGGIHFYGKLATTNQCQGPHS